MCTYNRTIKNMKTIINYIIKAVAGILLGLVNILLFFTKERVKIINQTIFRYLLMFTITFIVIMTLTASLYLIFVLKWRFTGAIFMTIVIGPSIFYYLNKFMRWHYSNKKEH